MFPGAQMAPVGWVHCRARKPFIPFPPWFIGCRLSTYISGWGGASVGVGKGNFLEKNAAVNTEPPIFIATGEMHYQPGEKGTWASTGNFYCNS